MLLLSDSMDEGKEDISGTGLDGLRVRELEMKTQDREEVKDQRM